jgi:aldose 1-epimerase
MCRSATLHAGAWKAGLLPELGGAVAYLTRDGRNVLRRAPDGVDDPLEMGCFPLVPYANRISHGRFTFAGKAYRVPLNFGDHPHSLHGTGWQSAWTVQSAGEAAVSMALSHEGGERWPWRFEAQQHVRLDENGLAITLQLTNMDDEEMPAGLGLHPYFPRDASTRLTMTTAEMWLGDETMIPTRAVAAETFGDWAAGSGFPEHLIDNSFDGWSGRASIASSEGTTRISATGARAVHLYAPPGEDFLCVEPVSHLPDALNQGFARDTLAPGETLALTMRITN